MNNFWIFSTGTELARGYSKDTNSSEIAQTLLENGFNVLGISILPDDKKILKSNFVEKLLEENIDGIIITGGLGPTDDDHTVDVLREITQKEIIMHPETTKKIEEIAKIRNIDFDIAKKQARILKESIPILNPVGLAPGMIINYQNKVIIALPGVPLEMKSMLSYVIEYLDKLRKKEFYEKKRFYLYNEPESEFQKNFHHLQREVMGSFSFISFTWGVSANPGYLKVFVENKEPRLSKKFALLIEKIEEFYREKFLNQPIEWELQSIFVQNQKTLSIAESCTGGLLGKILTDIPGSSKYFLGTIVSYSNELKINILKVPKEIIQTYGAVSKECAEAMVEGVVNLTKSDYGISITGIAGPDGGTKEKPVGTVFIGIKTPEKTEVHKIYYPSQSRERIREYSAYTAIFLLYKEFYKNIKKDLQKKHNN
ncbi:MAG: nicotinamide-nucleotide amidohydrolase family protein [Leptospiraceae bacterium]|nr:nicotinamide-nucleotide amidohydrolase family protein [Leptospiraceae bacterium]MDW7976007.1 nicotinamide-nucleotide amidohydrolase family protein [Leptospiraceae bacterium]